MSRLELRQSTGGRGSNTVLKAETWDEIARFAVEKGGVDPQDLLEGRDGSH